MKTLYTILSFTLFSIKVFAQPGELDSTFDGDGIVTTSIGTGSDLARSIVLQPDGKLVVAGQAEVGTNYDFALVRYNIDGTLDYSFGTNGKVTTAIGSKDEGASQVIIQPDGKLVAAGYWFNGGYSDFAVVRYNADGTLDSTFDNDGKVTTDFSSNDDRAYSIALQTDGKIVAASYAIIGFSIHFALARYNTDGTLDIAFDDDGISTTPIGFSAGYIYSVAIQPDGKIVAAGFSNNNTDDDFTLARYNTDGTLDTSFSSDGKVITAIGFSNDQAFSMALQSDGKIIATGYSWNGTDGDFALVRYNIDGTLDNSFGTDGIVTTAITVVDYAYTIAIQTDGKIIAGGSSNDDFALVRYNTDGTLDYTFSTNGKVTTVIGTSADIVYSLAIQQDGKIVAAGFAWNGLDGDFALARYNPDLALGNINFNSEAFIFLFPNPIQQTEHLTYILTEDEVLSLSLYDVNGREVRNFFTRQKKMAGTHKEQLTMEDIGAGNYFLSLSNGKQQISVKLVKE